MPGSNRTRKCSVSRGGASPHFAMQVGCRDSPGCLEGEVGGWLSHKTPLANKLTAVGFEPTPFRNGALSHRLRPLGQTVIVACDPAYQPPWSQKQDAWPSLTSL